MTEDQFNERERRWDVVRTVMMSSPEFKLENEKKTIEQIVNYIEGGNWNDE